MAEHSFVHWLIFEPPLPPSSCLAQSTRKPAKEGLGKFGFFLGKAHGRQAV